MSDELKEELRHTIFINNEAVRVLGGAGNWSIVVKQQGKNGKEVALKADKLDS